jgi:hypothetical protein
MVFRPIADKTRWEGLVVCTWLVLLDGLMLIWAIRRPVDWIKFGLVFLVALSIPLLAYWAYRTWAAFTLEYWMDRNAITLRWANVRQVVPLVAIVQMRLDGVSDTGNPGWQHWPAPYLRQGKIFDADNVFMAATRPLSDCLVLETEAGAFALSPTDSEAFVDAIQARYEMGPAQHMQVEIRRTAYRQRFLGESSLGPALLGIGLLGVLVLVGVLMVNFPDLPDVLAFQYNSERIPVVVRDKSALFLLPIIGLLTWIVNGFGGVWMSSRRESTGAYMLWGGTIVVQICSLLAMISIIP